jgi:hypothetical protein
MKAVYFELDNSLVDKFLMWVHQQTDGKVHLGEIRDLQDTKFDENGIPYASIEEQKEIEELLKDPDCNTIAKTKILQID